MTGLVIVAPTDAQLAYIASPCEERGLEPPVVYSKADASECIAAILAHQYDPAFYALGAPTFYGQDATYDDVPF